MSDYDKRQEEIKVNKERLSERNAESAQDGIRELSRRLGEMGALVLTMNEQINKQAQHLYALEQLLQLQNVRMVGHGPTE